MDAPALRALAHDVTSGRLGRRRFLAILAGLGISAPLAAQLLPPRPARAQAPPAAARRGGPLRLLYWQAPTILNPHLATGVKDAAAARLFYEPLAAFDPEGNLVPQLAAELPTRDNGGLARDGTWVRWRLKKGVTWHDGRPLTADDCVFTWEYAADPATAATSISAYRDLERVEKLDDQTFRVLFKRPVPFWAIPFCGAAGVVLPRHVFERHRGGASREAPANLKPLGTGPFRAVDFRPGDTVRAERFPGYHTTGRPWFDTVEMKGGGDAASAARAVLQTGEYDFAWNMQVEDELLRRLEVNAKGKVLFTSSSSTEFVELNFSDPWKEVDGERASARTTHPLLTDPAVRGALAMLVDRGAIQQEIYGRQGETTPNFLVAPLRFRSPNTRWEFSVERASATLDAAGWKRGTDGVRVKDGRRLRLLFQTSTNAPRQKTQAIVKQACARAGIEVELKSVVASAYFSSDAANPDTVRHFYADLQMYQQLMGRPDPQLYMERFTSWQIASKENKWSLSNSGRWRSDEYDRLWRAAEGEMDPAKRAALFIKMNDLVVQNVVVIPVLWRNDATAVSARLRGVEISPWESNLWNIAQWRMEG
ncbi:MAG TPA: peptide ABC transporter substrate-binding protein [Methylomirabilota bacterium]|nr:peptide ABC transporter substrate-binding protein [Methylomirabilota bacterium]